MTRGAITNSKLGEIGYFGNHLFQYMFLKTYARTHDLDVEVPAWIGNYLFDTNDPPVSCQRPVFVEIDDKLVPQSQEVLRDRDFEGYFQYQTSYYAPYRDYIRSLYRPGGEVADMVTTGWKHIAEQGRTLVGLHVRRNDFGQGFLYITPSQWYLNWLAEVWPTLDDPVLFIATDDPARVLPEFKKYRPMSSREMQIKMPRATYYPDFYGLTQCELLAIPNSTFSFVAAMLNERLQKSVRSVLPLQSFVDFDPWNDHPLYREHSAEDFKHIPGVVWTPYRKYLRALRRLKMKILGQKGP